MFFSHIPINLSGQRLLLSLRGILLWELLPCFSKHSEGNAVGWLNLIVATTVIILWKNFYDAVDNNGQDNFTIQIIKLKINFFD